MAGGRELLAAPTDPARRSGLGQRPGARPRLSADRVLRQPATLPGRDLG